MAGGALATTLQLTTVSAIVRAIYYQAIIHEPVTDRFLDVLRRADASRIALLLTSHNA